ncbi:MAG: CHAD domain-containing protein [Candidatus Electrothrix sp. AR4]|nr:CHAD domain-containing protein [Candidatus Electrothrix sp. AR4]
MKSLSRLSRNLSDTLASQEILDSFKKKYSLKESPPQITQVTFFDSFDWRLYNNNRLCFLEDNRFHLTDFTGREIVAPLPLKGYPPDFCHKLPESFLKTKLSGILEMRALLLQSTYFQTTKELCILNKDEKTVAVIRLIELFSDTDCPLCSVQLHEIRGYHKWFVRLRRALEKYGDPQPCTLKHTLQTVLAVVHRSPKEYSSKLSVALEPNMNARTAAKIIYRRLLTTMRQNEQGLIADLDSEFLHDFRVAIRRTRSGLDIIKDALESEVTERFKEDFRYLGKVTGPVRDLDVYLLMETDYKAGLPKHLQKGLDYFFADLAEKRVKEQQKLVQVLASPRYRSIVKDWRKYLERKDASLRKKKGKSGKRPVNRTVMIGTKAKKIIRKRFERVLRDGEAIHSASPDEALHRLRIQGKKLRYCLEFFSSLYPEKEMKHLVKQLKLLQNNLGLFNDLSVQQEMLNSYLATLKPGSGKAKKMGAAIGGLLTNLYHEQQQVRTEFEAAFMRFSSLENIELYRSLLKSRGNGVRSEDKHVK